MKINVEFESFEEMIELSEKLLGTKSKKEKTKKEAPEPKVEEPKAPTPEPEPESAKPEPVKPETSYTLTDVRAALAALAKKDKEKMKELLHSFGASNLKEVKEEDYDKLMEACGDA